MTAKVWRIVGIFSPQSEGLWAANCFCMKEKHQCASCWSLCEQQSLPGSLDVLWCAAERCWLHKVKEHNQSSVRTGRGGLSTGGEGSLNPGYWHRQEGDTALRPDIHIVTVYSSVCLPLLSPMYGNNEHITLIICLSVPSNINPFNQCSVTRLGLWEFSRIAF